MRTRILCVVLASCVACGPPAEAPRPDAQQPAPAAARPAPATDAPAATGAPATAATFPLRVEGTRFVDAAGRPFTWRGITAFRLAEMVAHGGEQEAAAYLDWAKSEGLTVVRVLLMAQHLFELTPEDGRAALPALLDLAKARGLAVEVVALADTKDRDIDYDAHIREVGRIAAEKGNAFVEIANEPGHPTQDPRLHDPAFAKRLADQLPEPLMVALGSAEYDDAYAAADYATYHFPREPGWGHVLGLARGAGMLASWNKPVISDEPIGAAAEYREGRRDNVAERFAASAALGHFIGLGATFHYEGGLLARAPDRREAACLEAWTRGLALAAGLPRGGDFFEGQDVSTVARIQGARASFARREGDAAAVLLVDPRPDASVTWAEGWVEERRDAAPGVQIRVARRTIS